MTSIMVVTGTGLTAAQPEVHAAAQPEARAATGPAAAPQPALCAQALGPAGPGVGVAVETRTGGAITLLVRAASSQGTPATYTVDWGDDVVDTGTQNVVRHVYPTAGQWPLRVTVTDAHGVARTSPVCRARATAAPDIVKRLGGYTRYDTSAAISQFVWASVGPDGYVPDPNRRQAHAVVLASGTDFPDALAGVPFAEYKQGPLLITDPSALASVTKQEIERILPKGSTVYILGGIAAVSQAVEDEVSADGYPVVRYGGEDRYATALQIATQGLGSPANVIVVTGEDFADALAAGPVATSSYETVDGKPAAVVLSAGATISDPATAAYVRARLGYIGTSVAHPPSHAEAIGGAAALALYQLDTGQRWRSPLVLGCDAAGRPLGTVPVASGAGDEDFQYVAGADRYATAACLTLAGNHGEPGGPDSVRTIALTNGTAFTDALTGAAALATLNGSVLLTDKDALPTATVGGLKLMYGGAVGTATLDIFGDEGVVSADVQARAESYMP